MNYISLNQDFEFNVFELTRMINEYGASHGTGFELMHEKSLLTPRFPFSFQKKDISKLPRGDEQQGVMHIRPLSTDVRPTPMLAVPASIPTGKFMTPLIAIQKPCKENEATWGN